MMADWRTLDPTLLRQIDALHALGFWPEASEPGSQPFGSSGAANTRSDEATTWLVRFLDSRNQPSAQGEHEDFALAVQAALDDAAERGLV